MREIGLPSSPSLAAPAPRLRPGARPRDRREPPHRRPRPGRRPGGLCGLRGRWTVPLPLRGGGWGALARVPQRALPGPLRRLARPGGRRGGRAGADPGGARHGHGRAAGRGAGADPRGAAGRPAALRAAGRRLADRRLLPAGRAPRALGGHPGPLQGGLAPPGRPRADAPAVPSLVSSPAALVRRGAGRVHGIGGGGERGVARPGGGRDRPDGGPVPLAAPGPGPPPARMGRVAAPPRRPAPPLELAPLSLPVERALARVHRLAGAAGGGEAARGGLAGLLPGPRSVGRRGHEATRRRARRLPEAGEVRLLPGRGRLGPDAGGRRPGGPGRRPHAPPGGAPGPGALPDRLAGAPDLLGRGGPPRGSPPAGRARAAGRGAAPRRHARPPRRRGGAPGRLAHLVDAGRCPAARLAARAGGGAGGRVPAGPGAQPGRGPGAGRPGRAPPGGRPQRRGASAGQACRVHRAVACRRHRHAGRRRGRPGPLRAGPGAAGAGGGPRAQRRPVPAAVRRVPAPLRCLRRPGAGGHGTGRPPRRRAATGATPTPPSSP